MIRFIWLGFLLALVVNPPVHGGIKQGEWLKVEMASGDKVEGRLNCSRDRYVELDLRGGGYYSARADQIVAVWRERNGANEGTVVGMLCGIGVGLVLWMDEEGSDKMKFAFLTGAAGALIGRLFGSGFRAWTKTGIFEVTAVPCTSNSTGYRSEIRASVSVSF